MSIKMAIAMKNPPIRGKRIIGSSDVAGIGIASVSHQHAIQAVLATIDLASHDKPSIIEFHIMITNWMVNSKISGSPGRDLNPRPRDYKSLALPG
jgi:hypothetical protein